MEKVTDFGDDLDYIADELGGLTLMASGLVRELEENTLDRESVLKFESVIFDLKCYVNTMQKAFTGDSDSETEE